MLGVEVWKDIKGYEGVYQVSNLGRVRSLDRINAKGAKINGVILKQHDSGNGYLYVTLSEGSRKNKRNHYVHRLIATHFIEESKTEGKEVNHKDGDKTNNRVDNLEWVTHAKNIVHGYENGLMKRCKSVVVKKPCGKKLYFSNSAACSRYFGYNNGWVRDRVAKHGEQFEYEGHVIKVR